MAIHSIERMKTATIYVHEKPHEIKFGKNVYATNILYISYYLLLFRFFCKLFLLFVKEDNK